MARVRGLDLLDRNGIRRFLDLEEAAQGAELGVLAVDQVGVFTERLWAFLLDRVLQLGNGQRIKEVILAARAVLIVATHRELGIEAGFGCVGIAVF